MPGHLVPLIAALGAFAQSTTPPSEPARGAAVDALPRPGGALPARFAIDDERLGVTSPWYVALGASFVSTRTSDGADGGLDLDFDEGWGGQLAVGQRHFGATDDAMMLDFELEGLYTSQASGGSALDGLDSAALLLNALVALHIAEETELFIGGGVGLGWLDVDARSESRLSLADEGPHFAWQLRAGVRFQLEPSTDLELGYRYLDIVGGEVEDGAGSELALDAEQHSLGLSVRFGG